MTAVPPSILAYRVIQVCRMTATPPPVQGSGQSLRRTYLLSGQRCMLDPEPLAVNSLGKLIVIIGPNLLSGVLAIILLFLVFNFFFLAVSATSLQLYHLPPPPLPTLCQFLRHPVIQLSLSSSCSQGGAYGVKKLPFCGTETTPCRPGPMKQVHRF